MDNLIFANFGQERDVNATVEELKIFEMLKSVAGENLNLTRKSDSYLTAMIGETDVARFKYTNRAKWILFPYTESEKIKLTDLSSVVSLSDKIRSAAEKAEEINNY